MQGEPITIIYVLSEVLTILAGMLVEILHLLAKWFDLVNLLNN